MDSQPRFYTALTDGSYRKHLDLLKVRLAQAMQETIAKLKSIGIEPWIEPKAGILCGVVYRKV